MLAQILQLVLRIVNLLEQALSLLGVIKAATSISAEEHQPFLIEEAATTAELEIVNPFHGLAALQAILSDIQTKVTAMHTDYQQRTQPVMFPATPPSGYAPDPKTVEMTYTNQAIQFKQPVNMHDAMVMVASHDWDRAISGIWQMADNPIFGVSYGFPINFFGSINQQAPVEDLSTVQPGDTVKSWLERETGLTWHDTPLYGFSGNGTYVWTYAWDPDVALVCLLTNEQLHQITGTAPQTAASPPVWPGLANVTLGTPVSFGPNDVGVTVPGPLDGVLVTISSYPAYKGTFNFAGDVSIRNIGGITFTSDNGQDEFPQLLGFEQAVYCPKTMTRAASAKVRIVQGTSGTITPWTRTP